MSTTYINTIVLAVITLSNLFGYTVSETELSDTLKTLIHVGEIAVTIFSTLHILYERYQKGGISAFGIRKI